MANKKETCFNRDNHPERNENELFLTNASHTPEDSGDPPYISSWDSIGWKTKREGVVAYDSNGVRIKNLRPDLFPVFVQKSEIEKADKDLLEQLLPAKKPRKN